MGLAVGPRPAGLAHRVLGHGREVTSGASFEIHGGGLDLVFPHHEDELAQSRARGASSRASGCTTGCSQFSGEKMPKSIGNIVTLRQALDRWGRETLLVFFLTGHWRKPLDFTEDDAHRGRGAQPSGFARSSGIRRSPRARARGRRSSAALDDDFNTAEALAVLHSWRDRRPRAAARAGGLRAGVAGRGGRGAGRDRRARRAAGAGARARDFAEADRLRAAIADARAGRSATCRTASGSSAGGDAGLRLRPAPRAGGAARGARGARALGDGAGADGGAVDPRGSALRVQVKLDRELTEAAGTRDHQGVVAFCEPYQYADAYELAGASGRSSSCLDQVSDPRNLGAVCRSAEGAGATGVVVPSHGSARVTPAVSRASAGAVEHLRSRS